MFRIGEFSKMSKTTIKTLRYYDEINLLKPQQIDKFTGYRFYATNQFVKLHKIQSLRQIGLSIEEIKLVFLGKNTQEILKNRKEKIINEINENKSQLSRIEFILSGQEEEKFMNYVATVSDLPQCMVYSKKMTVPNYDAYFKLIPEIGEKITKKYPDLKCASPEYCFIVYLDNEYKEVNFNVEFCEAVTELKPDFDDIVFKQIPSISAVSVIHKGAYSELRNAYAFAVKWIEENDYLAIGSPRESYIDGIWNTENETQWITQLQIPIAKKSEIADKYGNTKEFEQSQKKNYTAKEQIEIQKEADEILKLFAENMDCSPQNQVVQGLVRLWQDHITKYYYNCSKEILASLGQMYVMDQRFTQNIDRFARGTAKFMCSAIEYYCKLS